MPLKAERQTDATKQHYLQFEQGTGRKLGVVGMRRGSTIEDDLGFIEDF